MSVVLIGGNGQVGYELKRALAPLGLTDVLDRSRLDLNDLDAVRPAFEALDERPRVIVNATAYTAVDKAEDDQASADRVNHLSVAALAETARDLGACLVHYSTDYVFDGSKDGLYGEDDPTGPLGVYGRTKLAGEQAIIRSGAAHLIFRTSWVYARRGKNFAATMLRLAADREELSVVADQVGAPTSAELIADVTAIALGSTGLDPDRLRTISGIYHLVAAGETSWHGFARHVIERASANGRPLRASPERIKPIATADYPTPAKRPANSRLNIDKIERTFGLQMPHWTTHVDRTVDQWCEA
jgi:dTDP-4-dehydrorhamnose reductase